MRRITTARITGVALALAASVAFAQAPPTLQPKQGQSAEQMAKDQSDCQAAAKSASGYDPAAPPPPTTSSTQKPASGGRLKGAAVGAAAGAASAEVRGRQYDAYDKVSGDVKDEYRRNQAKGGATAGAVVGGAKQRQERRAAQQTQQAASQQNAQKKSAYDQAYQGCMLGRGYGAP